MKWKCLTDVNGSDHFNMIFNESIVNAEQIKLKNQKQSDIRNLCRSWIYFVDAACSYHRKKKSSILIYVAFFLSKKSKTLYSGHLVIADIFLGKAGVRYRQVWLHHVNTTRNEMATHVHQKVGSLVDLFYFIYSLFTVDSI